MAVGLRTPFAAIAMRAQGRQDRGIGSGGGHTGERGFDIGLEPILEPLDRAARGRWDVGIHVTDRDGDQRRACIMQR